MAAKLKYLLFEDESALDLLPLTYTRPNYMLRVGIDLVYDKWCRALGTQLDTMAPGHLRPLYQKLDRQADYICINGKYLPTVEFPTEIIKLLEQGIGILGPDGDLIAFRCDGKFLDSIAGFVSAAALVGHVKTAYWQDANELVGLRQLTDIFRLNERMLREDFAAITAGRQSEAISDPYTRVYAPENIFIEPGARIKAALLNAEDGPIYIGAHADIQEGAIIRGAHAIGAHTIVGMGALLRGNSSIGPHSRVGGEVSNSVIWGYSNKVHDGFLGHSVIGQWCNLGAGTTVSNLKNNYDQVQLHNVRYGRKKETGELFCGLMMGDHSRSGINTMFNTGTVVGVMCNIFGGGFPPKYIPNFSWGGAHGLEPYALDKALHTAQAVMARRQVELTAADRALLEAIHKMPH